MSFTPFTLTPEAINIAHEVVVSAIRSKVCEWEQSADDAVAEGRLTTGLMYKDWAFAADLLSSIVSSQFSELFFQAVVGKPPASCSRSVEDQVLDALALEVASAQEEPSEVVSV